MSDVVKTSNFVEQARRAAQMTANFYQSLPLLREKLAALDAILIIDEEIEVVAPAANLEKAHALVAAHVAEFYLTPPT